MCRDPRRQRHPLDVLADDEHFVAHQAALVDADDVRMAHAGGSPRLAQESLQLLGLPWPEAGYLEGHFPVQQRIVGPVHPPERPLPQQGPDFEAVDAIQDAERLFRPRGPLQRDALGTIVLAGAFVLLRLTRGTGRIGTGFSALLGTGRRPRRGS